MDIWQLLKEEFDEKIPRRTAILVKEEDYSLSFAYPADFGSIGYLFDWRKETTYDESPTFSIKLAEYSFPSIYGKVPNRNTFYYEKMEYFPSLVRRKIIFSNMGIEAEENFAQAIANSFLWEINLTCKNHPPYTFERKLYAIISVNARDSAPKVHLDGNLLEVETESEKIFVASNFDSCGVYKTIDDYLEDLRKGEIRAGGEEGNYIVLEYRVKLEPEESKKVKFGISSNSKERALMSFGMEDFESKIKDKWNDWFNSLPHPNFESELDKKAYYKCWWTVRLNYYHDERWGNIVLEALPVYRGVWEWGLYATQWHTSLNPELGSSSARTVFDLFLKHQREDGLVPHVIGIDEKIPGERCNKIGLIGTPTISWVYLSYYQKTRDIESLERWYPKLKRYYQYLNQFHDDKYLKLHLWAMAKLFEVGMDDYPSLHRVGYGEKGEEGIKEDFCYPAVFAAERCCFEKSMQKMAEILGKNDEAGEWQEESQKTKEAMDRILWDEEKKWYGTLHADGALETIVGIDGLFPFAYGLVDKEKAELARGNFTTLLGDYGVYTVSPLEKRFHEETYWEGPVWPTSCLYGMAACRNYYPDLIKRVKEGLVNFLLKYPSVWECMSGKTGKICRGPCEVLATPVVSSNVGAGAAIGSLLIYYGDNLFSI